MATLAFWCSGCSEQGMEPDPSSPATICPVLSGATDNLAPALVLRCLTEQGVLDSATLLAHDSVLQDARVLTALYHELGDSLKGALLDSSLARLSGFFSRGLLDDSGMVNRMVDHIAVSVEYVLGTIPVVAHRYFPRRTPDLSWHYYPSTGQGIFFQPVETATAYGAQAPDTVGGTLSDLVRVGDALWHYAVWRVAPDGRRFPLWLYNFKNGLNDPTPGSTFLLMLNPPWRSGMAQGLILLLYTELYRRTSDPIWQQRAESVLTSFDVAWSDGGIRLDDTSSGYWFEEAHPDLWIWNGSMQALVALGVYARQFPADSLAAWLWTRGLQAAVARTPDYDTGSWLLYSRRQGNVAPHYRDYYVKIAQALGRLTGDPLWSGYAQRWAGYTPPTGPCVGGPCP
jgi:hypothetical protein